MAKARSPPIPVSAIDVGSGTEEKVEMVPGEPVSVPGPGPFVLKLTNAPLIPATHYQT